MTLGKQAGFSLIELMIALVLGLVLTLGVTQIYLSSSETQRLTDGLARAQENVRFVEDILARDLRGAGNAGCLLEGVGAGVQELRQLPASGAPAPDGAAVVGWEHQGTSPGDTITASDTTAADGSAWTNNPGTGFPTSATAASNFVTNSDVLLVTGTYPADIGGNQIGSGAGGGNNIPIEDASGNSASSGLEAGTVIELVAPDCSASFRFVKGNNASATTISVDGADNVPSADISNPDVNDPDARLMTHRTTLYYIGEGANGGAALFSQSLANPNSPSSPQELVAGVENLQVLYGIGDQQGVNQYVTADDAALGGWDEVVAVRLAVLMRSDANVRDTEEVRSFNLVRTEVQSPEDDRVRLLLTKTFALRNRLN